MDSLSGSTWPTLDPQRVISASGKGGRAPVTKGDSAVHIWFLAEGLRPGSSPQAKSACSTLGWPADTLKNFATIEAHDRNGDLRQIRMYYSSPDAVSYPTPVLPQRQPANAHGGAGKIDIPPHEHGPLNQFEHRMGLPVDLALRHAAEVAAHVGLPAVFADGKGRIFVGRVCDEQRGTIEVSYQIQYLKEDIRPPQLPQLLDSPRIIRSDDPRFQQPSTGQEVQI